MNRRKYVSMIALALALTLLCGCGKADEAVETAGQIEPAGTAEPASEPAAEAAPGRQDGERYEGVVFLEGMEETVRYEHVRNETIGFEMGYEYESFVRQSGSDRERFVSIYEDPENPEIYLEVRANPQDAEAVAAAIGELLSQEYDIIKAPYELERAGSCIRIDASNGKGNTGTPDLLQTVYIIPADDGCRIAAAHYTFESADGFGARFRGMMNSFSVLPGQGEKRLSDEQALTAVRNYCYLGNPDLRELEQAGTYPIYWEVESGGEQQIVVLFRSYTGAQIRCYIDPVSGEAYVTEFVPGVSTGEERTDENLNIWTYWF